MAGQVKGEAIAGPGADRRSVLGGAAALAAGLAATRAMAVSLPFVGGGGGDGPQAPTAYGTVRGQLDDGISVFKGIPYGAPTGGGARFLAPQAPKSWAGVRPCVKFSDQCPQLPPRAPAAWASWATNTGEGEDCLGLNVWTPGPGDNTKRPVMVWLHGGGYSQYSGSVPVFDGARLCRRGDVVVVTLNHRLNLFGYLYLAQIGGDKFADSGNVGQLDLIFALQWVRDNIAAFGGDPQRVMIFGESGGGGKVSTLMAMPAAKGLFHRAAIQSGPGLVGITPEAATAAAAAILDALGMSAHDADGLQRVPADRLLHALKSVTDKGEHRLGPVVDAKNLPRDPFTPDAPAVSADVPVIVGYNATETTILGGAPSDFDLDWAALKARLGPSLTGVDADKLIADFRRLSPGDSASDLYFRITTLRGMGRRSISLAERKSALGAAGAYVYRLEFETPVDRLRSPHALDLPLVFDNVAKSASLLGAAAPQAQAVADQMSGAWIAMAHTGSPNAEGLASWPRYDSRARSTMLINTVSRAVSDPYGEERKIIDALPPVAER
jgi:para-nitrobenzyl esterase